MSLLDFFLQRKANVLCPYCVTPWATTLKPAPGTKPPPCSHCGQELPDDYLQLASQAPPVFLPMMGMPNTGKTIFMTAFVRAVMQGADFWKDRIYNPLSDETDELITSVKRDMKGSGKLRGATTDDAIKTAYVLQLKKLPRWRQGATLVLRDVPGEHFMKRKFDPLQLPFLKASPTSFLFYDFNGADAGAGNTDDDGREIDRVFRSYIMGMSAGDVTFSEKDKRNVVVVLTKAERLPLPSNLAKYLQEDEHWNENLRRTKLTDGDPFFTDAAMATYVQRLQWVSLELAEWVKKQPGGRDLMSLAKDKFVNLHFCMISAIPCGVTSRSDAMGAGWVPAGLWENPLRIMDPLYWALHLNSIPVA